MFPLLRNPQAQMGLNLKYEFAHNLKLASRAEVLPRCPSQRPSQCRQPAWDASVPGPTARHLPEPSARSPYWTHRLQPLCMTGSGVGVRYVFLACNRTREENGGARFTPASLALWWAPLRVPSKCAYMDIWEDTEELLVCDFPAAGPSFPPSSCGDLVHSELMEWLPYSPLSPPRPPFFTRGGICRYSSWTTHTQRLYSTYRLFPLIDVILVIPIVTAAKK